MSSHRLLITGGCGFVGTNFLLKLLDAGTYELLNVDAGTYAACGQAVLSSKAGRGYALASGRIGDERFIAEQLSKFRPTTIVNLAAETHVDRSIDGPAPFIETNVGETTRFFQQVLRYYSSLPPAARDSFRLIHISTDEVFGSLPDGNTASAYSRFSTSSPYAASKAAADLMLEAWQKTYGLPAITVRFSNIYGRYQFPEKLIPLATIRLLRGDSIPLYGDGEHQRDWLNISDAVDGLLRVIEDGVSGNAYHFCTELQTSNRELLEQLCAAFRRQTGLSGLESSSAITYVDDRPGHDRRYAMASSWTRRALDWQPKITLTEGLDACAKWYGKHQDWWQPIVASRYNLSRLGRLKQEASCEDSGTVDSKSATELRR